MRSTICTQLLIAVTLSACNTRSVAFPDPTRGLLLQESFDDAEAFARNWMTNSTESGVISYSLAPGRHGNGLLLMPSMPQKPAGGVFRTLDARPLRGMRLQLSIQARVAASDSTREAVQLKVTRPGAPENSWDVATGLIHVPSSGNWSSVTSSIDVPFNATSVEISILAVGGERLFDDLLIEAHPTPPDSFAPLTLSKAEELVTLFQMIGYLRFFYPGDSSAYADWHHIEVAAVDALLQARDPTDVHHVLTVLLRQIAPDALIYQQGSAFLPTVTFPQSRSSGQQLTRWVHVGYGSNDSYRSFRTGIREPPAVGINISERKALAPLGSCKRAESHVDIFRMKGKPSVRIELSQLGDSAQLSSSILAPDALHAAVAAEIHAGTDAISFGVSVSGFGNVEISKIRLLCDGHPVAEIHSRSSVSISGLAHHLYSLTQDHTCGSSNCIRIDRALQVEPTNDDIVEAKIGPNTFLRIPTVAWTDGDRTFPVSQSPVTGADFPANSRASRLASVLDLWILLRWFYPYSKDLNIDWRKTLASAMEEAARASTSLLQRHALSQLTFALKDDHARVIRPNIDDGLLPVLFRSFDDKVIVAATLPPFNAIPIGSSVVAIDGIPAIEARRRATEFMSAATLAFELRHSTYSLAFGHKGTFGSIRYIPPGEKNSSIQIFPHLDRSSLVPTLREPRPDSGAELSKAIFYIDLHTLDRTTWTKVLPKLKDAKAIIFDLRGYVGPAGFETLGFLTDHEIRSPSFLVPLVTARDVQQHETRVWYTTPRQPTLRARLFFLADARTASAPETILQIVRGERLGTIIGEVTGGTNGSIINYDLIGGMSMRFTGMRVLNHDGTLIQGYGITPDVVIHPTLEGIIAKRDEILEAAVKLAM